MSTPERERADFALEAESADGATILRVTGEIDLSTHERLADELTELAAKGRPIVIDMADCDFVDSSGIRSLLIGQRAAGDAGASVALAGASPQVTRVLEVTGVGRAIPMHPDVGAALDSLTSE